MQRRKPHLKRSIFKRKRPGGSPSSIHLRGKIAYSGGAAATLSPHQIFSTVRSIMSTLARNLGRSRDRILPTKEENTL